MRFKSEIYFSFTYTIFDYKLLGAEITVLAKTILSKRTHVFLNSEVVNGKIAVSGSMQSPMVISALVVLLRGGYQVRHNIKELTIPLMSLAITTVSIIVKCKQLKYLNFH